MRAGGMRMRAFFKRFLLCERGGIAVAAGLLLLPIIAANVVAVHCAQVLTRETRVVQAQAATVCAMAREGNAASAAALNALMNGFMAENLRAVRRSGDIATHSRRFAGEDKERIVTRYTPDSLVESFLGENLPLSFTEGQVTAERSFKPLELVIVMDGSDSVRSVHHLLREGVERVVDEVMGVSDENTYISLIAYSGYVNIGWEYKERLITPESRRIYYPEQRVMAQAYGIDDLLDPRGPEGVREGACVARPAYLPPGASASSMRRYVDNMEVPPASPADGFPLLMNDQRPVPTEGGTAGPTSQTYNFLTYGFGAPSATTVDQDMPFYLDEGNVRDAALVPYQDAIAGESRNPSRFYKWGPTNTAKHKLGQTWQPPDPKYRWNELVAKRQVIHAPWNCATMPMLVASRDKDVILDRLDSLKSMWQTAPDEGLAWALRVLSPAWREIWNRGTYPADYHGDTTKRILLIGGNPNYGYSRGSTNILPALCDKIKENGIELYILTDSADSPNAAARETYTYCAGDNFILAPSAQAFPEQMEKIARRSHVVRLSY